MFTIRCDYRENRGGCVIDRLRECRAANLVAMADHYQLVDEVLTTGDYVIQTGQFVLIIERKTWEDLAASIKDGRIFLNHKKMTDAAAAGCRICYMIEGRSPAPDFSAMRIGGILVGNMMAKLDHFAMRDHVIVEYTRDARHTALRLIELGKHMATLPPTTDLAVANGVQLVDAGAPPADIDAIVKKKHERAVADIQREMLMCIAGVGEKTAATLLTTHPFGRIVTCTTSTPMEASTHALSELRELAAGRRQAVYLSMLTRIKGVSDKIAMAIGGAIPIVELTVGGPAEAKIAAIVPGTGRRLGDKLAATIVAHFVAPIKDEKPSAI